MQNLSSTSRYLNELIDYGSIPTTRAEAILDMQRMGLDQPCIDRWLQGNELAQRLRERHARITSRIYLAEPLPRNLQTLPLTRPKPNPTQRTYYPR